MFTATAGTFSGHTFLVIDANGPAGYQACADFLIDFVSPTTAIDQLGMFI